MVSVDSRPQAISIISAVVDCRLRHLPVAEHQRMNAGCAGETVRSVENACDT